MTSFLTKRMFFQITASIVVPIFALGIPAHLLDKKLGTSPWILLGAILVAMHITLVILLFKFKKMFAAIPNPNFKVQMPNQAQRSND